MRPDQPRPLVVGPSTGPTPPFPLKLSGKVVSGFGRGSKELGIPTANIPIQGLTVGGHDDVESGVYYGWAGLEDIHPGSTLVAASTKDKEKSNMSSSGKVYPMVMSIGWNPFYKNTVRSVEVHILHNFPADFYGAHLNLLILGFIRPEYDYVSKEALIDDIKMDIEVAKRCLNREKYACWKDDESLTRWDGAGDVAS